MIRVLILIQFVVYIVAVLLLTLLGWLADRLSRPLVPPCTEAPGGRWVTKSGVEVADKRSGTQRLERQRARRRPSGTVLSGAPGCSYAVCGGADGE